MGLARTLLITALVLLFLATGGALLWYFAYGMDLEPPRRAALADLEAPVEIGWYERGAVSIEAQNQEDAFAALGYAHGHTRPWPAALWRQTAIGRLGEWFGEGVLDLDRFTRRLGLGTLAREAYLQLAEEDQALLQAYARGMNAALARRPVHLQDDFTLLDVTPEPWEPWHTLAVERLFAWLSTEPPSADTLEVIGTEAETFLRADALLRGWLHLYGFENSTAWAARDSAATLFYQRHVYGATAFPLLQEVSLTWPEQGVLLGGSLPGTVFFPAGKTRDYAWALLPTGTADFEWAVEDTAAGTVRYERLYTEEGAEYLLEVRRTGTTLQFAPPEDRRRTLPDTLGAGLPPDSLRALRAALQDSLSRLPDSTWTVRWIGLSPTTDFSAWQSLFQGAEAEFRLIEGAGLVVGADGSWRVLGSPEVEVPFDGGIVVGNARWSRYLAARLDSLTDPGGAGLGAWTSDFYSPWAAELAPRMIASVDSIPERAEAIEEALTYLRNWNYTYDRTSIGASLFDTWVAAYRETADRLPEPEVPDTVFFENMRRYQALQRAVAALYEDFGGDVRQWRWENVSPDRRLLPVWAADTLISDGVRGLTETRYAPLEIPNRGHPTTLFWGPSPILEEPLPSSVWEGWVSTGDWEQFLVRRRDFNVEAFLGRYRTSDRIPPPLVLGSERRPERYTTLVPL